MTPPLLQGTRVAVIGAGKSGLAAAALLQRKGALVTLMDERPLDTPVPTGMTARFGAQGFALAPKTTAAPAEFSLVVVSPGVPWNHPDLTAARALAHAPPPPWQEMVGEVEVASWFLTGPIAAVTGTNGKSTTTALLGRLLKAAGKAPFVGGNLGTPLSSAVDTPCDSFAVELSSFQLEGVSTFRAQAAAILNLTPDHLDRYPSLEAYAAAKARLLDLQAEGDVAVLNADDPWFAYFKPHVRGRLRTFGVHGDARPVDSGFSLDGTHYAVASRALRGDHNLANAMAATLLARALDVSPQAIQEGLKTFPGLAHRLELVRELNGTEWINDSKATNVESTAVALQAIPGPLIWIAGGRGKGAPYAPLAALLGPRLRRALLIGEDGPRLGQELKALGDRAEQLGTLEAAVARARTLAAKGDTVLLSPACASYDQFRNYEERGERFRSLVEAL